MDVKIIYEDEDVLVVDKPAGIVVISELIDELVKKYPELKNVGEAPRYGIAHRLDRDTSGILLVAKNDEALIFLQNQFKNREVEKKYLALVVGNIKEEQGEIKTLIGRAPGDKRKQKVYLAGDPASEGKREAITEYKVLERFTQSNNSAKGGIAAKRHLTGVQNYTLAEVEIKTGRRHQIRCHFSYLQHPIAGDKMYSFKNSPTPEGLTRQFLHANYLKIKLPNGKTKEFESGLPEELTKVLKILERE